MRKGGLLFLAPPCGLWVFLPLGWSSDGWLSVTKNMFHMHQVIHPKLKATYHPLFFSAAQPRSQGTTKKSWWDPEGDTSYRGVLRSNIFVMRMLYLTLGWTFVQLFGSGCVHMIVNCSDLGIQGYIMLTFEEYTLWLNSQWPQSGPFILWCDATVTTYKQHYNKNCLWKFILWSLEVMFLWAPVARLLRFCKARSAFDEWLCDCIVIREQTNYTLEVSIMIGSVVSSTTLCRRVCFPMGAYGAGTLKQTVPLGWTYFLFDM